MRPTHECLDAHHPAKRERDFGLVMYQQPVICNRLAQLTHQSKLVGTMLINLWGILSITTLTALGHIHGNISTSQQGCEIEAMLRCERDTNASSYSESMAID